MARHLAEGRKRFIWELSKFFLIWILIVLAVFLAGKFMVDYLPKLAERVSPSTTVELVEVRPTTIPSVTTEPVVIVTTTTTTIPATTTTTTTIPTAVDPSELTVLVLNSTGRTGLAASATADLAVLGYQTIEPTNISPERSNLEVFYMEGRELEAVAISELYPGAVIFLDTTGIVPDGVDLVVVLGSDFER